MISNNSPAKTLSRLIHSDYFDNIIPMYYKDFEEKINLHIMNCKHPKCFEMYQKRLRDNDEEEYNKALQTITNDISDEDFEEFRKSWN